MDEQGQYKVDARKCEMPVKGGVCGLWKRVVIIPNGVWASDGMPRFMPIFICVACDFAEVGAIPNKELLDKFEEGRTWLRANQTEQ